MANILKNYKQNKGNLILLLPSIVLLLFYFTEFLSKILKYNYFIFDRVSGVTKLTVEVLILIYLIKNRRVSKKFFYLIGGFFSFYLLGQASLLTGDFLYRTAINIYALNGYLFVFILFYALKISNESDTYILKSQVYYLGNAIKLIFLINTCAIIIGLLFSLDLFKTYLGVSNRFGFNGFFLHASHSSYIYIILIIYFFKEFTDKRDLNSCLYFTAALFTSLLVGTKTIYLFSFLFIIYLTVKYLKAYIILFLLILLSGILVFFYSFFIDIFKTKFVVLYDVYNDHGLITMLFSHRNQSFSEIFLPYIEKYWGFINYLFGGAEFNLARTEIELLDLFWFFGLLGSIIYLYLFYFIFLQVLLKDKILRIPMLIFLICISLAGSFLTNSPVIPYFIALYFMVYSVRLE